MITKRENSKLGEGTRIAQGRNPTEIAVLADQTVSADMGRENRVPGPAKEADMQQNSELFIDRRDRDNEWLLNKNDLAEGSENVERK